MSAYSEYTVLVTDGEQRASLALVRSLGRAGHRVVVCSRTGRSLAGASRFARADMPVADALREPDRFVDGVRAAIREHAARVLVPVTEASLLALLPMRGEMPDVCIPFADAESVRGVSDKARLMEIAAPLGIATPAQHVIASPAAWPAVDLRTLRYPVVLKPSRSVGEHGGQRIKLIVQHAAGPEHLERASRELPPVAYPLLVQQRVVGPGVGIFLLLWDGEMLASFAHRRIRETPPAGGVSVYRESIPADPALVARSRALLERFGWRGVAMIEYKLDAATGTPYLMEINGRFWGSLQLAVDAGVDFPALLVSAAMGERPRPVHSYRAGVRSRWEWGEVNHLLARLRRSAAQLDLPPDAPSRGRAVRDFLTVWKPGDRTEILRLRDPMPFVRETIDWFHRR
ncbi:MAG: ATP-grasp domain-containing protein [Gemmatimonadaceae bacterium]